nr:MAG TPA: putative AdoMet-dependent methyltransferase [Siphoviridae sp. ctvS314]
MRKVARGMAARVHLPALDVQCGSGLGTPLLRGVSVAKRQAGDGQ